MRNSEIREIFFSYFKKKKHHKVLSSSLVPAQDPTLLFTNAGMNQFKGVFLQEEKREYQRAVSIQKCLRVSGKHNDFDEVGKTEHHHTFFEMMGNFSFGNYFKEKAIEYAWELLTEYYKLKPEKLRVSVFKKDDEAYKIWEENIGIKPENISTLGEKDNFWQMGETGPCGPCSEIHFKSEQNIPSSNNDQNNPNYLEVWNLVFMQYYKDEKGALLPLPAPSIDTGMGMERLTTVLQKVASNYQTDLFKPIIEFTAELAGIDPAAEKYQVDLKVIADHIRALSFLIADGILPANDGRGYVLRRILRRAAKHGKTLGFSDPFLYKTSSKVIEIMKEFYPELEYNKDFIKEVILAEEERFKRTLLNGLKKFEELLDKAIEYQENIIPGKELFKLSDTYGFPLDFAIDLANEKDLSIDIKGYQSELEKQKEKSRIDLSKKQRSSEKLDNLKGMTSIFSGYEKLEEEATILAIYEHNQSVSELDENHEGIIILDKTPLYAEAGGQVGDRGIGKNNSSFFNITNTTRTKKDLFLHYVELKRGKLKIGDRVRLLVDKIRRKKISVHHSATHLLHAALKEILGLHVKQAGSYVGPEKLRFDFTHFKAMNNQEIENVERIVNHKIRKNLSIGFETTKYEEAIENGATAIFDEKYTDIVRVISMEDFSKELCGGTHLEKTGEIGIFKIISESSISSGIRRIEAVAGESGYDYIQDNLEILNNIQSHFKQSKDKILNFLLNIEKKLKEKEKSQQKSTDRVKKTNLENLEKTTYEINGIKTVIEFIDNFDPKKLNSMADIIKNQIKGISVLSTNLNEKSAIVVSIFKDLTKMTDANLIIKEIAKLVNGNGGGRKDFAQAGGDPINDITLFKKNTSAIISKHTE